MEYLIFTNNYIDNIKLFYFMEYLFNLILLNK